MSSQMSRLQKLVRDSNDQLEETKYYLLDNTYPSLLATNNLDSENTLVDENENEPYAKSYNKDCSSGFPGLGYLVKHFWPIDKIYYSGTVQAIENRKHTISYNASNQKRFNIANKPCPFASNAVLQAISAQSVRIQSDLPAVLDKLLQYFGSRPFLQQEALCFPIFALQQFYFVAKIDFKKTVQSTLLSEVPGNAKTIPSHVFYKP